MNNYSERQKQILLEIKNKIKETDFKDVNCPNEKNIENWVWIGDKSGLIGNANCHYEFIFHEECSKNLSLEVHLCETGKHEIFKNMILPKKLKFDNWYRSCNRKKNEEENGRIVFQTKGIDINGSDSEIVQNSLDLLEELHNAIGEQLLEIMQAHPELLSKQLKIPKLLKNSRKIVMEKNMQHVLIKQQKRLIQGMEKSKKN